MESRVRDGNFIGYDLGQDDSWLKAGTTICYFLRFLRMSSILERILVYSATAL